MKPDAVFGLERSKCGTAKTGIRSETSIFIDK